MLKNILFSLVHLIICVIFFIFMEIIRNNRLLFEEHNLDEYTNLFCNKSTSLACFNKYKKKKFILLMPDGTAFDELPFNYNFQKYNLTAVFKNYDKEYKITGSNFETEFTGKYSRNYFYDKIKTDNLFRQLYYNNYRLSYYGMDLPVYDYLGKENNIELSKYTIDNYVEKIAFSNLCDLGYNIYDKNIVNYFKKISDKNLIPKIPRDEIYKYLDDYFNKEKKNFNLTQCLIEKFDLNITNKEEKFGIIYYSVRLDNLHHNYSKMHWEAIANSYIINEYMIKFQEFINENPEFALIIISDHGGQIFPLDETLNQHGSNVNGNEGIFTIYTKDLGDNFDKLKYNVRTISRYDYATTFPQIIEGINIPLNSIGKPLILGNDNIFRFSAVKSKEEQVISFLTYGREKFKEFKNKFEKLEKKIKESQIENIDLCSEEYYNERINELINIQVKAADMISSKINFNHLICFFGLLICFSIMLVINFFLMKKIIIIDIQNKLSKFIIWILIYIFPNLIIFLLPHYYYILTRIRIKYFILILICLCFLIFNKCDSLKNGTRLILMLYSIPIIYYHSLFYIKYFFIQYYHKIIFLIIFYLIYILYIYYETKKVFKEIYIEKFNKNKSFIFIFFFCMLFLIVLLLFDIYRIENKTSNFLNSIIGICFIFIFILNDVVVIFGKGKKINNFPLMKLTTFFFNIYLLNETEKLVILLIFYPICELIFKEIEKLNICEQNLKFLIIIIFIGDILTIYTRPKIIPSSDSSMIYRMLFLSKNIIGGYTFHSFYIILSSYFHSISDLNFINNKSFFMRFLVYLKVYFIFIYYIFNLFIQKNQIEILYVQSLGILHCVFVVYDDFWIIGFKITHFLKLKIFQQKYYENFESNKCISNQNNEIEEVV